MELAIHRVFCLVVVVGGSVECPIPSRYREKSGTVSTTDIEYWETKKAFVVFRLMNVVTRLNVACLKRPLPVKGL